MVKCTIKLNVEEKWNNKFKFIINNKSIHIYLRKKFSHDTKSDLLYLLRTSVPYLLYVYRSVNVLIDNLILRREKLLRSHAKFFFLFYVWSCMPSDNWQICVVSSRIPLSRLFWLWPYRLASKDTCQYDSVIQIAHPLFIIFMLRELKIRRLRSTTQAV